MKRKFSTGLSTKWKATKLRMSLTRCWTCWSSDPSTWPSSSVIFNWNFFSLLASFIDCKLIQMTKTSKRASTPWPNWKTSMMNATKRSRFFQVLSGRFILTLLFGIIRALFSSRSTTQKRLKSMVLIIYRAWSTLKTPSPVCLSVIHSLFLFIFTKIKCL